MAPARPAPVQTVHIGDIAITSLPDGEAHFVPTGMFPASAAGEWSEHDALLDDDGRYVSSLTAFLIETGDRKILVDLGLGPDVELEIPDFATVSSGRFLDSLRRTGVEPAQIDTVVFTHLHSDHCGWTSTADGQLTFPNADYLLGSSAEWEFWQNNPDAPFAPSSETVLAPLEKRVTIASDGQSVAPGVTLRATPGHTPGHQSIAVSSGSSRAMIMGDVAHAPVQVLEPDWSVVFDVDAALAKSTRDMLFDELEGTDVTVAFGHFPETNFGRVMKGEGKRYWSVGL